MPNYRRARNAGATYFFTVVTARRRPVLTGPDAMSVLRRSVAEVRRKLPFSIDAWVVLPDHMHAIWTMPVGDVDFSTRWGRIKTGFTKHCGVTHVSAAGHYAGVWQPRFWEHLIRDEADLRAHTDYVHYNPVKHGHAARVVDWPYSSFHRSVRLGMYAQDWGCDEPPRLPAGSLGE
jgi:putative transposase